MKVCYDRKNDVVSIYYDKGEVGEKIYLDNKEENVQGESNIDIESNIYDNDTAANLILDTVDITSNGNILGFRVFNASKYYQKELLEVADEEVLEDEEIKGKCKEKVIAMISKEGMIN